VAEGALYCFGAGSDGALGTGDVTSQSVPRRVGAFDDHVAVVCGDTFTCTLRTNGEIWCFGAGASGQLGTGDFAGALAPVPVDLAEPAVQLAAGEAHACAVTEGGALYCWGSNVEGQLGQDDPFPDPGINRATPVRVGLDADWVEVTCGQGHTCARRTDGSLWCWGRNSSDELGLSTAAARQIRTPQRVGDASDWQALAAGQHHTCGIRGAPAELFCWGSNAAGQLGGGNGEASDVPRIVLDVAAPIASLATDTFHTCVLNEAGGLWCAGRNVEGQLGTGDTTDQSSFLEVGEGDGWQLVTVGRFHTCAVAASGRLTCTGENHLGQLGTGDSERRSQFSPVTGAATSR
jgi:alpha-tubulin suppressor-like RCC1 family protein